MNNNSEIENELIELEYVEVKIPALEGVDLIKIVESFNDEQLYYVGALAKAYEKKLNENMELQEQLNIAHKAYSSLNDNLDKIIKSTESVKNNMKFIKKILEL
ncbi:MAG: hypothetical protein IJ068_06730 [Bacilli bacterium]|nr:hypothetical protein [Bacilli bacterium]